MNGYTGGRYIEGLDRFLLESGISQKIQNFFGFASSFEEFLEKTGDEKIFIESEYEDLSISYAHRIQPDIGIKLIFYSKSNNLRSLFGECAFYSEIFEVLTGNGTNDIDLDIRTDDIISRKKKQIEERYDRKVIIR